MTLSRYFTYLYGICFHCGRPRFDLFVTITHANGDFTASTKLACRCGLHQ